MLPKINFNNHLEKFFYKYFITISLVAYVTGPFFSNLLLTTLMIAGLYFISKNINDVLKDFDYFFFVFVLFIFFKDFFILDTFENSYAYLIRIFIILVSIKFIFKRLYLSENQLLFLLFFISVDCIFQYITGVNILGFQMYENNRLTSFFNDEPIVGSFLMKIMIIYFFISNKNFYIKYITSIIILIIIFLTGERMAFIQCFFALFILSCYEIYSGKIPIKKYLLLIFLLLTIFMVIFNFSSQKQRYLDTINGLISINSESFSNKASINDYKLNFQAALDLWKNSKYLGNGHRSFRKICKYQVEDKYLSGCSTHPHNLLLEILVDHGFVGLFLFFIFIIKFIYKKLNNKENLKIKGSLIFLFALLSLPIFTSQSIFSSYYNYIYFLPLILLSTNIVSNESSK